METSRDAGSIPAASTKTGYTTRLETNKARWSPPAGLVRFVHISRDLRDLAEVVVTQIA